jgi:plastocyanin
MTEKTTPEAAAEAAAPAQAESAQAAAPADNNLTINDLQALKAIIDVAAGRGVFKPAEMTVVGQTYTKLSNFLESVSKGENDNG